MIARTWRGATTAEDAEAYVEYLNRTGFREFRDTPGNLGAFGLRKLVDGRAVFLIVSLWESEDAVRRFAGADVEHAVFYPEDDRFLVERDDRVEHFEVVHQDGVGHGPRDEARGHAEGRPVSGQSR